VINFFKSSGSTIPYLSTGKNFISKPHFLTVSRVFKTAICSIGVEIISPFLSQFDKAIPFIAQLSDSVPPDVKYISSLFAFNNFATFSLEFSISSSTFFARGE